MSAKKNGPGPTNSPEFTDEVMTAKEVLRLLAVLVFKLEEYRERLGTLETEVASPRPQPSRPNLDDLRREMVLIQQLLSKIRALLFKGNRHPFSRRLLDFVRNTYYDWRFTTPKHVYYAVAKLADTLEKREQLDKRVDAELETMRFLAMDEWQEANPRAGRSSFKCRACGQGDLGSELADTPEGPVCGDCARKRLKDALAKEVDEATVVSQLRNLLPDYPLPLITEEALEQRARPGWGNVKVACFQVGLVIGQSESTVEKWYYDELALSQRKTSPGEGDAGSMPLESPRIRRSRIARQLVGFSTHPTDMLRFLMQTCMPGLPAQLVDDVCNYFETHRP